MSRATHTSYTEWFQDQVCLPVMIRIFVSSAVSSYLRSYLRLETAKSMAFEARAATSARSRRAPVALETGRLEGRSPPGPFLFRHIMRSHASTRHLHRRCRLTVPRRLSFAEVYHGEATALSRGEPLPSGRVARPLQLKPGGLPRTEGARSTPLRSVSVGRGNRRAHPQNRWR
jgi:hypothetical protein